MQAVTPDTDGRPDRRRRDTHRSVTVNFAYQGLRI